MERPTHFISCDWGTTNFRLRVVATESLEVLAEYTGGVGVRSLNEQFGQSDETDRLAFYVAYLDTQLEELPAEHRHHPLVVSGMASANIGMRDLPYGELPIDATAANFFSEDLTLEFGQRLRLISGIKSANGMMRGEETQALGLLQTMTSQADGTLILPGTHSKHLKFTGGGFTDFTSFLTGELFEIISRHSILANSVTPGTWNALTGDSFRAGVLAGHQDGCAPHLFGLRAGQVLRGTNATDNFYQLSGLLIGEELAHLPADPSLRLYLAGSGPLLRLYRYALEILGYDERLTVYDDVILLEALLRGQRILLLRQL